MDQNLFAINKQSQAVHNNSKMIIVYPLKEFSKCFLLMYNNSRHLEYFESLSGCNLCPERPLSRVSAKSDEKIFLTNL